MAYIIFFSVYISNTKDFYFLKESSYGDQTGEGDLSIFILGRFNFIAKFCVLFLQARQFCFQSFYVHTSGGTQVPLNIVNSVGRSFGFFVQTNQYFGQRIDDTTLFKVFSEFFFLLFSCLYRHIS